MNEYGDIYSEETCWIENTRRGFVEGVEVYLSDHEDDEILVVVFDSKFAWGINASELLETCIKYHVDMKIHAFEMGMEFNQVIEIIDGKIVKDEELHFKRLSMGLYLSKVRWLIWHQKRILKIESSLS